MSVLSFNAWAEDYHLFVLGVLSFAAALFGRTVVQRRWHQWPRLHPTGMGASYFYAYSVLRGPARTCPYGGSCLKLYFGSLPSAIGVPLIIYALRRHPLVLELSRSMPSAKLLQRYRSGRQ